jgi:hypothetical protein
MRLSPSKEIPKSPMKLFLAANSAIANGCSSEPVPYLHAAELGHQTMLLATHKEELGVSKRPAPCSTGRGVRDFGRDASLDQNILFST